MPASLAESTSAGVRGDADMLSGLAVADRLLSEEAAGSSRLGRRIDDSPSVVTYAGLEAMRPAPQQATGWLRVLHLTLAAVWFSLAVLGAILPGLPCTCFLLLTSYSLCRSSDRLHQRLLNSRLFGPMLRHWREHRAVRPGVKAKALGTMAVMLGLSLTLTPLPTPVWWAVAGAGVIGAGCVVRLRVVEG